jgi:hypothetical protein
VIAWLWEAGVRHRGVTDDPERAKEAAAACLMRGEAARVEQAIVTFAGTGTGSYVCTGTGWKALRPRRGPVTWEEIAVTPKRAAAS